MRSLLVVLLFLLVPLAGCLSGSEDAPSAADQGDDEAAIPYDTEPRPVSPLEIFDRFEERSPGVEREMRLLYGPFTIPPGQDNNRVTIDIPAYDGFMVAVSPTLYDVESGRTPDNQEVHIHHAHWFRVSDDPEDEYYTLNLAWVFGTGEERTSGSFHDRADVDMEGPRYGINIEQGVPQALIYMLHNKRAEALNLYVALDMRFVYGTADQIASATSCDTMDGEGCHAGEDFHHLTGKLWGTTFDVPRQPIIDGGDGTYIHPMDIPTDWETRRDTDNLGRYYTAGQAGTAIASAGHMHPNGLEVVVANLGPAGSACEADLDGDGFPGVTLLRSQKIEQVPEAAPHSEEYQMGATKFGWRAPLHEGDRIAQFGVYANDQYATWAAMSFTGLYVDRQQIPEPRGPEGCTVENSRAYLLDGDPLGGDPTEGIWNRAWSYDPPPHCGIEIGFGACDKPVPEVLPVGQATNVVHIADFLYLPGDQSLSGDLGAPIRVTKGEQVTFINEDVGAGIRHTVTSCKFPCNGNYVANYPHPDGAFHSGKLGNLDPIDGGAVQTGGNDPLGFEVASDLSPVWTLDTTDLDPGYYTFYCFIHPWMRGWIEIVE